jgi:glycosyltransferase involved in cell wall biosynthesis
MEQADNKRGQEQSQIRPHVLIIHHYMWPDESPTSKLFSDLAFHLAGWGCRVSVFAARERYIIKLSDLSKREVANGVEFYRVKGGQGFNKSATARLLAGFILLFKWLFLSFKTRPADLLIVGTDPPFSVWLGALLKIFNRTKKLIIWVMDLYPDAILAEGITTEKDIRTRLARFINKHALTQCDGIVDLGQCMRQKMPTTSAKVIRETITPWSPHEPVSYERDKETERLRKELFGNSQIGLLYSGAFGRAHEMSLFLQLAMEMATYTDTVYTVIASYGPKFVKIKSNILSQKIPIKCLDYDPSENYVSRLKTADFHLVSVNRNWTGVVVPSKFFAALAVGRPVIADVDDNSTLSALCRKYDLGWVVNKGNMELVKKGLLELASRPEKLKAWQKHVFNIYQKYFSKKAGLEKWDNLLK